jgi:predicted Fe-Mo cluster-binding NifX family protein
MRDSILSLMDAGIPEEEIKKIRETALSVPRVKEVKAVLGRRSGPFVMVEVEISVPENLNVSQAHMVATEVERRLTAMKEIDHATVHVEPPSKKHRVIAVPMDEHGPASVFGSAPYFELRHYEGEKLIKREKVKNPGYGNKVKKGVKAALFLIERGVDEVHTRRIGEDSREILEDAGVVVRIEGKD